MNYKVLAITVALCGLNLSYAGSSQGKNPYSNTNAPENYDKLSACDKQDTLWQNIESSKHKVLPEYSKLGLFQVVGLATQPIYKKVSDQTDFAPKGWKKHIHKRGAVAKVKFTPIGSHPYTGVFKGAECALIRLSLTYKPVKSEKRKIRDHTRKGVHYRYINTKSKAVAPGLAFKVLRDNIPSANISALYTLSGQAEDYNFFAKPLSNIVPAGPSFGEKVIHKIFSKVAKYPEELKMKSMATYNHKGEKETNPVEPRQIFFVANSELSFSSDFHDIRNDFLGIKTNTVLYKVYALPTSDKYKSYSKYRIQDIPSYVKESQLIGEITTTSNFVASEFGDTELFFKHDVENY
jgi:hypothetical protein